ncbi:VanZ family protein [Wukongibacter baidiensis]|uniref:VanZ family protein n=1 Tax=Wukongibacter baidiensis TaxID=1723361 RepID=UPI003D7FD9F8
MDRKLWKKEKISHLVPSIGLLVYLSFLVWRMFFFAYSDVYRVKSNVPQYNLIPFRTIINFVIYFESNNLEVVLYNILGNIIVFIPLGFLISTILRRKKKTLIVMTTSLLLILCAETMQLVLRVGVFDVDDIILNLIGCYLGYISSILVNKYYN